MPWKDFRHFLHGLEEAGELKRISREVSPEFEVAAYVRRASDTNGPAFVFERIRGFSGWTMAAGVYGTYARLALALGTDIRSVTVVYANAIRSPVPPVSASDGPVKEVVLKGSAVDCTQLPLVRHSEHDAGR